MAMPQPQMPPEDVLASFFGGRTESDPLTLAKLRGGRISEAQNRLVADTRAGDVKDAVGTTGLLKMLQGEADADPDTGIAAHAAQAKIDDAEQQLQPGPIADLRKHNEAISLQKSLAEHPPQNVSPFAGSQVPHVPGGVSAGPGAPSVDPSAAIMATSSAVAPPPGVDPDRFAKYTADLTPEAAAKVAQLLRYDAAVPTGNALARPEWSAISGRAALIDPSFDMKTYGQRQEYLKSLAAGRVGTNAQSLDTVMHHLNNLDSSSAGLGNSGLVPWNALTNSLLQHTVGNPREDRFNSDATAVSDELGRTFKDLSTDTAVRAWRDQLSSSSTPDSYKSKMSELADLIAGRLSSAQSQYQRIMGRPAPDFFSPESRQTWEQIQSKYGRVGRGAAQSPAAPSSLPSGVTVRQIR